MARWHDDSRVSSNILLRFRLLRVRENIKEGCLNYFPRRSFDILQGCTNSGPGRLRIPEMTGTDLASAYVLCHLILLGPVFQSSIGQSHSRENGGPVYSRPERVRGT